MSEIRKNTTGNHQKELLEMTTQDQEKALTLMRSGKNIRSLGDAGTGKSWVLRKFLEENQGKNIVRCAFRRE